METPDPVPGTPRHARVAGLLTHAGKLGQSRLDLDRPELTLAEIAERTHEPARGMAPLALVLDGAGDGAARPRDLAELLRRLVPPAAQPLVLVGHAGPPLLGAASGGPVDARPSRPP